VGGVTTVVFGLTSIGQSIPFQVTNLSNGRYIPLGIFSNAPMPKNGIKTTVQVFNINTGTPYFCVLYLVSDTVTTTSWVISPVNNVQLPTSATYAILDFTITYVS
jgi:hypothetical protein